MFPAARFQSTRDRGIADWRVARILVPPSQKDSANCACLLESAERDNGRAKIRRISLRRNPTSDIDSNKWGKAALLRSSIQRETLRRVPKKCAANTSLGRLGKHNVSRTNHELATACCIPRTDFGDGSRSTGHTCNTVMSHTALSLLCLPILPTYGMDGLSTKRKCRCLTHTNAPCSPACAASWPPRGNRIQDISFK